MIYLTRRPLSRRALLRGAGAALALPLLESMIPAGVARAASAAPRTRLACVYVPHGAVMSQWLPSQAGTGFEPVRNTADERVWFAPADASWP